MNQATLPATLRETSSRGELRKLRRSGRIPGVVYGKSELAPMAVAVEARALQDLLGSHAVLNLEIAGFGKRSVLLTEVQREAISGRVRHVDFHRINMNESIRSPVRLEASGKSAGEEEGGMLQMVLHELEVECLPSRLPESIVMDVSGLRMGDNFTAGELRLPDGVKTSIDPETVIATVLAPQKGVSEDEAEAADDAAEEGEKQAKSARLPD